MPYVYIIPDNIYFSLDVLSQQTIELGDNPGPKIKKNNPERKGGKYS